MVGSLSSLRHGFVDSGPDCRSLGRDGQGETRRRGDRSVRITGDGIERGALGTAPQRRRGRPASGEGRPEHHRDRQRQVEHHQGAALVEVPELAGDQQGGRERDQLGEVLLGRPEHRGDHQQQVGDQDREPEAGVDADPEAAGGPGLEVGQQADLDDAPGTQVPGPIPAAPAPLGTAGRRPRRRPRRRG